MTNEELIGWAIAQFGILMFLIGYFIGRKEEYKKSRCGGNKINGKEPCDAHSPYTFLRSQSLDTIERMADEINTRIVKENSAPKQGLIYSNNNKPANQ